MKVNWRYDDEKGVIANEKDLVIAYCNGARGKKEEFEFIPLACNRHDALVAALREMAVLIGEADALQHAGLMVPAKVWSEIYQCGMQASALLASLEAQK